MSSETIVVNGVDPIGNVLLKDNRIFRGIKKEKEEFCIEILHLLENKGFLGKYVVNTRIAYDVKIEPYNLILEHEKITILYPDEWSFLMVKDAGNFVLEFMSELEKIGFGLVDSHGYNLSYHRGKFCWTDFGSIGKNKDYFIASLKEFVKCFIHPRIVMIQRGFDRGSFFTAHSFLEKQDVKGYLSIVDRIMYEYYLRKLKKFISRKNYKACIEILKKWFNSYELKSEKSKKINCPDKDNIENIKSKGDYPEKQIKIIEFFEKIKP